MKCILLLFFTNVLFLSSFSQINTSNVKFEKPRSSKESFYLYIETLQWNRETVKDSLIQYMTTYITDPKWIRENKKIKSAMTPMEINDMERICKIQYQWHLNEYNKDIENLFIEIGKRDQLERMPMTDCYLKTKNNDSCRNVNNWEAKMNKNDSLNWHIIDSLILKFGFPKSEWLGRKGYRGFMTSYFSHNKDHVDNYYELWMEAGKRDFILTKDLEDSYSLHHCQAQKYNSIYCHDKSTGKNVPCTPCLFHSKCCEKGN